jgi:hypothetical protein
MHVSRHERYLPAGTTTYLVNVEITVKGITILSIFSPQLFRNVTRAISLLFVLGIHFKKRYSSPGGRVGISTS